MPQFELLKYTDKWGPEKIIFIWDPKADLKAILVIDNTTLGPSKGGIRLLPDLTLKEIIRLARAMTWKCALARLPFGGAKCGILADPRTADKEKLIRALAQALKNLVPSEYVAGPDMNTSQREMDILAEEIGTPRAATGKSLERRGLPHELGSTGFGIMTATREAAKLIDLDLKKASLALEGFGNVGSFTAQYLSEVGAKLIASSDINGCLFNPQGLNVKQLVEVSKRDRTIVNYPGEAKRLPREELFSLTCDILIPGARPDAINEKNKDQVKAKLIIEAANAPIKPEIEKELEARGITIVPDFLANAGGVISSYIEYIGGTKEEMFERVGRTLRMNTREVLKRARETKKSAREIALEIAQKKLNPNAKTSFI